MQYLADYSNYVIAAYLVAGFSFGLLMLKVLIKYRNLTKNGK